MMPAELGRWLRDQREARGWSRAEMARRLTRAGQAKGDKAIPGLDSMMHNMYRWERGTDGLTERYKLYYCQVLGIPLNRFGSGHPDIQHAATSLAESVMVTAPGFTAVPPLAQVPSMPGLADP
jgi:transcriptional regulator with XRE-family HTH domain